MPMDEWYATGLRKVICIWPMLLQTQDGKEHMVSHRRIKFVSDAIGRIDGFQEKLWEAMGVASTTKHSQVVDQEKWI